MSVFTGYGRKTSVLVHDNDNSHCPRIDKFLASLRLTAPAQPAASAAALPLSAAASRC
ncbi:MAG: hypothetical protein N3D71_01925 [Burkholderiaceae bacterium]|nr:hypothetical protein [Burkholderiaceae bacterium]